MILKNIKFASAVPRIPCKVIAIIDCVPKLSNQNGSDIIANGVIKIALAIVVPVASEMKLIIGTNFETIEFTP